MSRRALLTVFAAKCQRGGAPSRSRAPKPARSEPERRRQYLEPSGKREADDVSIFHNVAFRWKALALLGAGLNLAWFQLATARGAAGWNAHAAPPRAARAAGLASISLWAAVVLLGRWIGFTKGYDFTVPAAGLELPFAE
jgi:hypothetical protein